MTSVFTRTKEDLGAHLSWLGPWTHLVPTLVQKPGEVPSVDSDVSRKCQPWLQSVRQWSPSLRKEIQGPTRPVSRSDLDECPAEVIDTNADGAHRDIVHYLSVPKRSRETIYPDQNPDVSLPPLPWRKSDNNPGTNRSDYGPNAQG